MKSSDKKSPTATEREMKKSTPARTTEHYDANVLRENLAKHAPPDWEKKKYLKLLSGYLDREKPLRMIVLTADIRKSTFLMKESVSFRKFAQLTGKFIDETARLIKKNGGWFDKFTGDGFLAYWLWPEREREGSLFSEVFGVCHTLLYSFKENAIQLFRENSRNFPAGVGLTLGIDAGDAFFVTVAGDLTIVGPPVVGAVRMVNAAQEPWETLCNVYLGEQLFSHRAELLSKLEIEVRREHRKTKEYELQEVYPIEFHRVIGAI